MQGTSLSICSRITPCILCDQTLEIPSTRLCSPLDSLLSAPTTGLSPQSTGSLVIKLHIHGLTLLVNAADFVSSSTDTGQASSQCGRLPIDLPHLQRLLQLNIAFLPGLGICKALMSEKRALSHPSALCGSMNNLALHPALEREDS